MKRLLLIALGIICYHVVTFAQEVKVEVRGIRSAKGAIMVMAQQDSESKPVYAMATAVKDTVTVVLKDVPWEKFLISLFRDENGNWELDKNEQGIPVEGYAREKCKKEVEASATVKVKMYYPVNDCQHETPDIFDTDRLCRNCCLGTDSSGCSSNGCQ